jgi:hypothetical protein
VFPDPCTGNVFIFYWNKWKCIHFPHEKLKEHALKRYLAGRSYALVIFAIPVRHPPCKEPTNDKRSLNNLHRLNKCSPKSTVRGPDSDIQSRTKVAHSSVRPEPAAACSPGLLCASSKLCSIRRITRLAPGFQHSPIGISKT